MKIFFIIISFLSIFNLFAADTTNITQTDEMATFSGFVKKMCTGIRNAEALEHELAFAQELLGSLEKTNYTTLSETDKNLYRRAAYGLFVGNLDLNATNPAMQEAKKLAIPIALNGELVVMQTPLGKLVVLEKLTTQNQPAWLKYAETEYSPYSRLDGFDSSVRKMEEGIEKEALMWMEFRKDGSGIDYFRSRIKSGPKDEYDKYIAYVYAGSIEELAAERKCAETIKPDHIEMVMTVQASKDSNTYSPTGISRTVDCAKKMLKNKTDGKSEDKIEPLISVWFHALTCKIVQTKYSNIDRFWTVPMLSMRRILIKALFPHIKFPSTQEKEVVWREFTEKLVIKEIIAGKVKDYKPNLPWADELEFGVSSYAPPTEIKAKDLLATILP